MYEAALHHLIRDRKDEAHPGDMNDAWKSAGYTDVEPEMRDAAMNLGVNLIYYAFTQWDDAVSKARK